jgi:hypothetical protein
MVREIAMIGAAARLHHQFRRVAATIAPDERSRCAPQAQLAELSEAHRAEG